MNRQADVSVVPTASGARSDRSPRVAARPIGAVLLSIAILATTLAACASSSAPSWTFAPAPPFTMKPEPVAATCPPGSTPDEPGPADQARPVPPETAAFDRRAGRLVALASAGSGVETWAFDVCTNTWTRMHPNREPPDGYRLVYDIDSGVTVLVASGHAWAYDLAADTWTEKSVAPVDATPWAYDSQSGLVVGTAPGTGPDLWSYDVETDRWTSIHQANGPGGGVFAYDASVDRIVAYGLGGETLLFDIRTGTWSRSGAETPVVIGGYGFSAPAIEYDEAAERTVVFGNGRLVAYDATADRWEILDLVLDLPSSDWDLEVYDPVNGRLVGWGQGGSDDPGGVAAFDLVTGSWTVLLEPGDGQPGSSSR